MTTPSHPSDERLSALAGADPDALADRPMRDHVASCTRCRELTEELSVLRSALAELPDLAPPTGFRAWVPQPRAVEAPRHGFRERFLETLRRATAPAMLAGASLAIVGAVGVSGLLGGAGETGTQLAAPEAPEAAEFDAAAETAGAGAGGGEDTAGDESVGAGEGAAEEAASPELLAQSPAAPEEVAREEAAESQTVPLEGGDELTSSIRDRGPWLIVLTGGALLLVLALVARRLLRPEA